MEINKFLDMYVNDKKQQYNTNNTISSGIEIVRLEDLYRDRGEAKIGASEIKGKAFRDCMHFCVGVPGLLEAMAMETLYTMIKMEQQQKPISEGNELKYAQPNNAYLYCIQVVQGLVIVIMFLVVKKVIKLHQKG